MESASASLVPAKERVVVVGLGGWGRGVDLVQTAGRTAAFPRVTFAIPGLHPPTTIIGTCSHFLREMPSKYSRFVEQFGVRSAANFAARSVERYNGCLLRRVDRMLYY